MRVEKELVSCVANLASIQGQSMRALSQGLFKATLFILVILACDVHAEDGQPTAVLFENVRIFDGKASHLSGPACVGAG